MTLERVLNLRGQRLLDARRGGIISKRVEVAPSKRFEALNIISKRAEARNLGTALYWAAQRCAWAGARITVLDDLEAAEAAQNLPFRVLPGALAAALPKTAVASNHWR